MKKVQKYLLEGLIGAFLFLFASWAIGYYGNALYEQHFELKSCWDGFTTLGGAGFLAAVKYIADSLLNSEKGDDPYNGPGA